MNELQSTILNLIYTSQYHEAKKQFDKLNEIQQSDLVVEEASVADNISILGFVEFLISRNNTYFNHNLAADALIQMCWIEGAYNVAFYHAAEMYRLKPDTETKKFLLFFYDLPEKILSEEYAIKLAESILQTEPDYLPAMEILHKQSG